MAMNPITVIGFSPWEILGLHHGASPEEVSGAMRLLAKSIHPDILPRGKALFQVVQAAAQACKEDGKWPGLPPEPDHRSEAAPVPKAPAAPRARSNEPTPPRWNQTKKGGWARRFDRENWLNVFAAKNGAGWRFAGPDGEGGTHWDSENFSTAESAMDAADEYFRGR
jgi:hypothetical protein